MIRQGSRKGNWLGRSNLPPHPYPISEQYIRLVQWEDETYNRLSELMQHIIEHSEKKDESEIYRHFNRLFAGEEMLSAILAKEVHATYRTSIMRQH